MAWVADPLALAVAGTAVAVVHRRRHRGAGATGTGGRDGWLLAGAAVLVLALVSPVAGLSSDLVAAHMLQHLLLVVVAAPLVAAGDVGPGLLAALPPRSRRLLVRAWRRLPAAARAPGAAVVAGGVALVVVLWAWHVPALHVAAVEHPVLHLLEHITLLAPAVTFWGGVVHRRARPRQLLPAIVLTAAALVMAGGVLGALLTFAGSELYTAYRPELWGVQPLDDQRFAGMLLWVAGGPPYALAAAVAIVRGLAVDEDLAPRTPTLLRRGGRR